MDCKTFFEKDDLNEIKPIELNYEYLFNQPKKTFEYIYNVFLNEYDDLIKYFDYWKEYLYNEKNVMKLFLLIKIDKNVIGFCCLSKIKEIKYRFYVEEKEKIDINDLYELDFVYLSNRIRNCGFGKQLLNDIVNVKTKIFENIIFKVDCDKYEKINKHLNNEIKFRIINNILKTNEELIVLYNKIN